MFFFFFELEQFRQSLRKKYFPLEEMWRGIGWGILVALIFASNVFVFYACFNLDRETNYYYHDITLKQIEESNKCSNPSHVRSWIALEEYGN
jgi:hypothetical protein